MPRSPINLRDPRVVIVVASLLLVVAAVNLRTFLPLLGRGNGSDETWDPDAFVPPTDTAELTRVAAGHVAGGDTAPAGSVAVAGGDLGGGLRDPFRKGRPAAAARIEPPAPAATATPAVARSQQNPRGPVCSAVLFTGELAAAVIDGETRRVGDGVGEWRVATISPDGVRLRGPRGEMFLVVGARGDGAARYPLVTQPAAGVAGGSTALEPQPGSREP